MQRAGGAGGRTAVRDVREYRDVGEETDEAVVVSGLCRAVADSVQ